MKKTLTSIVLLAALTVMPAGAQIKFGVKGGLNNTNMSITRENLTNKSAYGWYAGPTLKFSFPLGIIGLGADLAAFYDERRTKTEIDGMETTIRHKSILIPVNARANLNFTEAFGLYVATGPQFGFNVGRNEVDLNSADAVREHFQLRKSQYSWNFGAGLLITKHLEIGATYNLGIGKTGDVKDMTTGEIRDTPKQKSWTVSAAYYF